MIFITQAVATAAAFSVGLCVASKQTIDKHLSAEDILTCCKKCIHGNGCQGGSLEKAFGFLIEYGICTGGTYGSQDVINCTLKHTNVDYYL